MSETGAMTQRVWSVGLVSVTLSAVAVVSLAGAPTARACSCAVVSAVDAVALADVVFTGQATTNEGAEFEPVWTFEVDGVVEGDVAAVETVIGEDWAVGCGTDFSRFGEPVVVYAGRSGERQRALGCMPTLTAEEFAAAAATPTGTNPAEAVMIGRNGLSDIAVLDGAGRKIASGAVGLDAGVVAHCPGTSLGRQRAAHPQRWRGNSSDATARRPAANRPPRNQIR